MKNKSISGALFVTILFVTAYAGPVYATDRYVGTCGGCYASISAAIADSVANDRIYVYPGTYNESVNLDTMSTKGNITLIA